MTAGTMIVATTTAAETATSVPDHLEGGETMMDLETGIQIAIETGSVLREGTNLQRETETARRRRARRTRNLPSQHQGLSKR